jgi:hypothetical protein
MAVKWKITGADTVRPRFEEGCSGRVLPCPFASRLSFQDHQDREEDYGPWIADDAGVYKRAAEFLWEDIRFQSTQEWFVAPASPALLVFRQTVETSADCVYRLESWLDLPEEECGRISEMPVHRDHFCGIRMNHPGQKELLLCETTQLAAASLRVSETTEGTSRVYQVTAWEETPVKLEKFVSIREQDGDPWYPESALAECRQASRLRFDALRDGAKAAVTEEDIDKLRRGNSNDK